MGWLRALWRINRTNRFTPVAFNEVGSFQIDVSGSIDTSEYNLTTCGISLVSDPVVQAKYSQLRKVCLLL